MSRNTDIYFILVYIFLVFYISLSFSFWTIFKDCLSKYGYNFDDVSRNGYTRPSYKEAILK